MELPALNLDGIVGMDGGGFQCTGRVQIEFLLFSEIANGSVLLKIFTRGLAFRSVQFDVTDSEIPKEEADTQMGLALPDASLLRKTMGDAFSGTMKALASVTNQGFQWQPAAGGQGSPPVEKLAVKLQMRRGRHRRSYSDVDKLEDILMWTDAWRTGKAFGVGLYALICVKVYLDSGV